MCVDTLFMLFAVEGSNIYNIFADLYHQYSIVGDLSTADQPEDIFGVAEVYDPAGQATGGDYSHVRARREESHLIQDMVVFRR